MAENLVSVIEIDDTEDEDSEENDDTQVLENIDEQEPPNEKKSRTRRGIASREIQNDANESDDEDVSIHIYTSRVDSFRESKKNFREDAFKEAEEEEEKIKIEESANVTESPTNMFIENLSPNRISNNTRSKAAENKSSIPAAAPKIKKPRRPKRIANIYKQLEETEAMYLNSLTGFTSRNTEWSTLPDDNSCYIDDDIDKEMQIKLWWRGEIAKIVMKKNQCFATVLPKLSEKFSVPERQLLLSWNDTIIKPGDTPNSLCLKISDIIDCCCVSSEDASGSGGGKSGSSDPNVMELKLQSKDQKKKITFVINKKDCLAMLIERYAKEANLSSDKILLKFDGETLDPNDTAEDADLEDGFCVDVVHCK